MAMPREARARPLSAPAAAPGCLDHEHVIALHLRLPDVAQHLHGAISPLDAVDAHCPGLAARAAEGTVRPPVAEDRSGHRRQEADAPHAAVAAAPAPFPARAGAQAVA